MTIKYKLSNFFQWISATLYCLARFLFPSSRLSIYQYFIYLFTKNVWTQNFQCEVIKKATLSQSYYKIFYTHNKSVYKRIMDSNMYKVKYTSSSIIKFTINRNAKKIDHFVSYVWYKWNTYFWNDISVFSVFSHGGETLIVSANSEISMERGGLRG